MGAVNELVTCFCVVVGGKGGGCWFSSGGMGEVELTPRITRSAPGA